MVTLMRDKGAHPRAAAQCLQQSTEQESQKQIDLFVYRPSAKARLGQGGRPDAGVGGPSAALGPVRESR